MRGAENPNAAQVENKAVYINRQTGGKPDLKTGVPKILPISNIKWSRTMELPQRKSAHEGRKQEEKDDDGVKDHPEFPAPGTAPSQEQ